MPTTYDDRRWPLLICTAVGESTDDDLAAYTAFLLTKLRRKEIHAVILDATRGKTMRSTHRRAIADFNHQNEAELKRYRAGLALVTPSAALRGMLTAVYWLFKPPFPYAVFETLPEAEAWAQKRLDERQHGPESVPPPSGW